MWAAALALALASARLLPDAVGMPALASWTASIPEIPYASVVVTTLPLVWFFASCAVG